MRLSIDISGSLDEILRQEITVAEKAVTTAVATAGSGVRANWQGQVRAAGLGGKLANTIRQEVYPKGRYSLGAAALVYTRAPKIIGAHESGAIITARGGRWLAIPMPGAGMSAGGKKITPGEWQYKNGQLLTFVPGSNGRNAFLVAERARINTKGFAVTDRRRGKKRATSVVPIFFLVRQARLPKRLDLMAQGNVAAGSFASGIITNWRE